MIIKATTPVLSIAYSERNLCIPHHGSFGRSHYAHAFRPPVHAGDDPLRPPLVHQELSVLSRWFEKGSVPTPEAKFLDIILYR